MQIGSSDTNVTFPQTDEFYQHSQLSASVSAPGGSYTSLTEPALGLARLIPTDEEFDEPRGPVKVAQCSDGTSEYSPIISTTTADSCTYNVAGADYYSDFNDASTHNIPGTVPGGADALAAEARSFIDFEWDLSGGIYDTGSWDTDGEGASSIFSRLSQLFAFPAAPAYFGDGEFWIWDHEFGGENNGYVDATDEIDDYAIYDYRDSLGNAPTVWAVDTDNCGPKYCEEGEESAVTLNNTNEGDVETSGGYYRANLKFFAAADKNQLPIRRVIVDWGDNSSSGSSDPDNYYKNHRGLQDEEEDGVETQTQSKCLLEDEWGKTANSCDPNYFNYSHTYRCWDPTELDACQESDDGNLLNSPCTFDFDSCVFQPRVHVRDNWGWCTGTCDSTSTSPLINVDGGSSCFDGYGGVDSVQPYSECNYDKFPDADESTDPWVYYDGYIYVDP